MQLMKYIPLLKPILIYYCEVYTRTVAWQRQISKLSRAQEDNIKIHHREIKCEVMDSDKMSCGNILNKVFLGQKIIL